VTLIDELHFLCLQCSLTTEYTNTQTLPHSTVIVVRFIMQVQQQSQYTGWPNKNRTFFEIPYFCSHYRHNHAVFAEVFRVLTVENNK